MSESVVPNPGSFKDFEAELKEHGNYEDNLTTRTVYAGLIDRYADALAAEKGITREELHNGVQKQPPSDPDHELAA